MQKDAILLVLGSLRMRIQYSSTGDKMKTIIDDFVFPEFTSQTGFLRYRAVWCILQIFEFIFENCSFADFGIEAVCKLLMTQNFQ